MSEIFICEADRLAEIAIQDKINAEIPAHNETAESLKKLFEYEYFDEMFYLDDNK